MIKQILAVTIGTDKFQGTIEDWAIIVAILIASCLIAYIVWIFRDSINSVIKKWAGCKHKNKK